eukprot:CAMPEP_0194288806 /NCGR_PEP_ID=MMETSP0169-20130528/37648_1 /TAXON_ID=218684 /ORGANISM="Corethron pennatum, Strain L29A3" /LENGTH=311 /DNA_ID=CAMNT_0039035907 /DNA_START=253 /DNA_END=1188 /DNA_ORIENTATION=+
MYTSNSILESLANLACSFHIGKPRDCAAQDNACGDASFDFGCNEENGLSGVNSKRSQHESVTERDQCTVCSPLAYSYSKNDQARTTKWAATKIQDQKLANRERRKQIFRERGFDDLSQELPPIMACLLQNEVFSNGLCFTPVTEKNSANSVRATPSSILCQLSNTSDLESGSNVSVAHSKSFMKRVPSFPPRAINALHPASEIVLLVDNVIDLNDTKGISSKLEQILEVSKDKKICHDDIVESRHYALFDSMNEYSESTSIHIQNNASISISKSNNKISETLPSMAKLSFAESISESSNDCNSMNSNEKSK